MVVSKYNISTLSDCDRKFLLVPILVAVVNSIIIIIPNSSIEKQKCYKSNLMRSQVNILL